MNWKINFDIAVIGNNKTYLDIVENINTKVFNDYGEAKQVIDTIANELTTKNLMIFEDIGLGKERRCIAFSLMQVAKKGSEEVLEYFFVELDEKLDSNHTKEMKN